MPPSPPTARTPRLPVVGALLAAVALVVAWRYGAWSGPTGGGGPPWRPDMGPGRPPPGAAALTLPAALAIALTVGGIVLTRWRPVAGYLAGILGLVGYAALDGPLPGLFVPALVLAISLLRRVGLPAAAPWWALVPVALWATWWSEPAAGLDDWAMWGSVTSTTTWVLLPTLFVALGLARRQARARERAEEVERAAAAERLRLAREIHDVVGHSLSLISLQSGVALRVLDADPGQARASLEAIRSSSKDALAELRETLGIFRGEAAPDGPDGSPPLSPTPTIAAVTALVEDVRAGGVRVGLGPLPDGDGLGAGVQAVAYRVVQESLTNAIRHAPGAAVEVRLHRTPTRLVVRVTNERGPTRAPRQPVGDPDEGTGLRGMRERVDALGGTLVAGPTAGGFTVEARLPTRGAP